MLSLLLQFKSPSDTFSIHFKVHYRTYHLRTRQPACFRSQCSLSRIISSATAYTGSIGPLKESLESDLITEMIPTGKEATIAAASAAEAVALANTAAASAAEAVALANTAAKVAKDAALMFGNEAPANSDHKTPNISSGISAMHTDDDLVSTIGDDSLSLRDIQEEDKPGHSPSEDLDNLGPTDDEHIFMQLHLSESLAVRSGRQIERKIRKAKAATGIVSVISGSSCQNKLPAAQEIDNPFRCLRCTTSTSRLLTATEELELLEGIQVLLNLENLHMDLKEQCGSEPTFAQWAAAAGVDQKTLRKHLTRGIQCKDKMFQSNIGLVFPIAKSYQWDGINLHDLIQEGCRGLVKGTEKFDASKGFKFSTYAQWWIKEAVWKSLSVQSRTIRLPFHLVDATIRVRKANEQLYRIYGRHPNDEEVAEATGLTMKRLRAIMLIPKPPRSLDRKIGFTKLLDDIADPDAKTPEEMLIKQDMKHDLDKVLLNSLDPRENQISSMEIWAGRWTDENASRNRGFDGSK